jgi:hypothetical protein
MNNQLPNKLIIFMFSIIIIAIALSGYAGYVVSKQPIKIEILK